MFGGVERYSWPRKAGGGVRGVREGVVKMQAMQAGKNPMELFWALGSLGRRTPGNLRQLSGVRLGRSRSR